MNIQNINGFQKSKLRVIAGIGSVPRVVARKQAKSKPETNPYLQKFLKSISWEPRHLAVFAGKIEYQKYRFWDRLMIRFIMWITKGPTDPKANIEYTNWSDVGLFGQTICDM